jgi:predicted amidohydrolase YtcJ
MIVYEMCADLNGVTTIEELQEELKKAAQKDQSSAWVIGLQFDEEKLYPPRLLTRHDLDVACPDRPAIIVKRDGHMAIANTRAIEAAGVSASTKDPEGGKIDRASDGYPLGPFRETAVQIPFGAMPMPPIETIIDTAKTIFKKIAAYGITSAGIILQTDAEGVFGKQGEYDVMLMSLLLDFIPINLYSILVAHDVSPIEEARKSALHNQAIGSQFRIGGLKFWADGTFGSCTAYMREPFSDQPDKKGFLTLSPEEIFRRMLVAHKAGLQIAIHAIGDAANRLCIDLYDRLLKEYPKKDHRHRIEHASLLDAEMLADISRLGLVVSTQPLFIHSEKGWLYKRLGQDRAKWVYPLRALLDAGIKVAGASDAPIESLDVLHAIQCCVTREGFEPQQGISVYEAIRMFTIDAAYAQFEESVKGSISVGKRADMVILNQNPLSLSPQKIQGISIVQTICGGKVIYQNNDQQNLLRKT